MGGAELAPASEERKLADLILRGHGPGGRLDLSGQDPLAQPGGHGKAVPHEQQGGCNRGADDTDDDGGVSECGPGQPARGTPDLPQRYESQAESKYAADDREGTDKGETRAKPEIWAEMDKFKAAASTMQDEMTKLNAASKTGSLDAIKAQFGKVGQACKACHDNYRKE